MKPPLQSQPRSSRGPDPSTSCLAARTRPGRAPRRSVPSAASALCQGGRAPSGIAHTPSSLSLFGDVIPPPPAGASDAGAATRRQTARRHERQRVRAERLPREECGSAVVVAPPRRLAVDEADRPIPRHRVQVGRSRTSSSSYAAWCRNRASRPRCRPPQQARAARGLRVVLAVGDDAADGQIPASRPDVAHAHDDARRIHPVTDEHGDAAMAETPARISARVTVATTTSCSSTTSTRSSATTASWPGRRPPRRFPHHVVEAECGLCTPGGKRRRRGPGPCPPRST